MVFILSGTGRGLSRFDCTAQERIEEMMRIAGHALGIQQGTLMLFSDFESDGPMWRGEGPREVRRVVRFDAGFLEPPTVLVGVSLWDCDSSANLRADIAADAVTTEGFEIVFRTWADSRIARIRVGWTAMGPLPHEDDWPL
jgi:hypothetical protein